MRHTRALTLWVLAGTIGAIFLAWVFPRAFPFLPREWKVNAREARAIALERLRDLGPPVEDPFVGSTLDVDPLLERRLQLSARERGDDLAKTRLAQGVLEWQVSVYKRQAPAGEWTYRAWISPRGEVTGLRLRIPPEQPGKAIDPARARVEADTFLKEQGFDLSRFHEPQSRRTDLAARTDLTLRYRSREEALGKSFPYGIAVVFAGERLSGFQFWYEDPQADAVRASFQLTNLLENGRILVPFLMLFFIAFPFLRLYHEGEVGVRRGAQIFVVLFLAGVLNIVLSAKGATDAFAWGGLSRRQAVWVWALQLIIFWVSATALTAFLSWSVGEVLCRERWGHKLAAFDALFQRQWGNATVARSSLRGVMIGLALTALLIAALLPLQALGAWPFASFLFGWSGGAYWVGLAMFAFSLVIGVAYEFFGRLLLLPFATRRLGVWGGGIAAAVVSTLFFWPPITVIPIRWEFLLSLVVSAVMVVLFLAYDLLTVLLASITSSILWVAMPLLLAEDNFLRFQGVLALALVAIPLVVSLRHLHGDRELVYRYEDVPPHVRRIAERERQRVELETARRIQSSILPDLPPRLAGVDIAHAYLPASEVGGDFYDVLALEDGRLAVAVGDVAGHGVSSGLIMSMAKSALAVQVTFNPEVPEVFRTLNRTVYQTARKRLLATLCYALIDPRRLEMVYACAGHLHPYRITAAGRVESLESIAYPLGVRGELRIEEHTARLAPGDTIFLFSDGLVEARREGSEDLFGFERLEQSLARHTGRGPEGVRDGVLADVTRFTGDAPREDDQTIVVLRLP